MRGVHQPTFPWKGPWLGSSPHARGPRPGGNIHQGIFRFIPAYAGSTLDSCWRTVMVWVHPRIRGVHPWAPLRLNGALGSSPHTRGPPLSRLVIGESMRFIPAYAGSTCFSFPFFPPCLGSSPHTRGPQAVHRQRFCAQRFIPAYAGSTPWASLLPRHPWVHPRIRGVHRFFHDSVFSSLGSSPHTRGPH